MVEADVTMRNDDFCMVYSMRRFLHGRATHAIVIVRLRRALFHECSLQNVVGRQPLFYAIFGSLVGRHALCTRVHVARSGDFFQAPNTRIYGAPHG
jgi:hypothetical protein